MTLSQFKSKLNTSYHNVSKNMFELYSYIICRKKKGSRITVPIRKRLLVKTANITQLLDDITATSLQLASEDCLLIICFDFIGDSEKEHQLREYKKYMLFCECDNGHFKKCYDVII